VFANGSFFAEVYLMARKADAGQALKTFVLELGVPEELTVDGSKEQTKKGTDFMLSQERYQVTKDGTGATEPGSKIEKVSSQQSPLLSALSHAVHGGSSCAKCGLI
jgi:hypothetical protein